MLQLNAIVSGKVQHVGYRSRVVTMARTLDLKGCVRNLEDGRVYVLAEGDRADLERFCRAIRMEDPLIRVDDIQVHLNPPKGAWDGFYKISGERETDSRLDTATVFLKELIIIVKDGFRETNLRLGSLESKFESMEGKLDQIVAGQEKIAYKIDAARREIVSEVKELRCDLQEGAVSRLSRKKGQTEQHAEVKPKIHIKPS